MADIENTQRSTHKILVAVAWICIPLIVVLGIVTRVFKETAATHPNVGRLHVKYAADKSSST